MKYLKRTVDFIIKHLNFLKKIFIWCCMIIVVPEINLLKNGIVSILNFIESIPIFYFINSRNVKILYILSRKISIFLIVVGCGFFLIYYILRLFLEINEVNKNKQIDNNFEKSFYKYLTDENNLGSKKSYLITGDWGSGKTYLVNNFIEEHFRYSRRHIYRISCFGIDSRELLVQEVEKQIENQDNSIINWTQYIPFLGLPLFSLLKKSYSLQNVSSKSIFIFDDFERITPLGINQKWVEREYKREEIARNEFGRSESREFYEINNEFKKIEKSFERLINEKNLETTLSNLQKYNIVTGLINDLIENNEVKIVVICNTNIMGKNYMDKVFRGKLDCITYNKVADEITLSSIFESVFTNYVLNSEINKEIIRNNIGELIEDFRLVWYKNGYNNLREIKTFFQAFIETIDLIKNGFSREMMFSLFYSLFFFMTSYDNLKIKGYNKIQTGSNLLFGLNEHHRYNEHGMFSCSKLISEVQWIGLPVASYWLLNIDRSFSFDETVKLFTLYPFNELECFLLNYENIDIKEVREYSVNDYSIEHLLFVLKIHTSYQFLNPIEEDREKNEKSKQVIIKFLNILDVFFKKDSIDTNEISIMLLNELSKSNIPDVEKYRWFEKIYMGTKYEHIFGDNKPIFKQYEEYVKDNKNHLNSNLNFKNTL